ncbi:MAG: regulatory protein [Candidatus Endobugula sp.]|jgi:regulatory protein
MANTAYTSATMSLSYSYSSSSSSRTDEVKAIKVSALRYLARREYSRVELYRRLSQKFSAADSIQHVLDELRTQGYQSDSRFTESFIRAKISAGNGPFKIKIELREKGICESTALAAFDRQSIDWQALAQLVNDKRFGSVDAEIDIDFQTEEEKRHLSAKKMRYLRNKGFYKEHIDMVLKTSFISS